MAQLSNMVELRTLEKTKDVQISISVGEDVSPAELFLRQKDRWTSSAFRVNGQVTSCQALSTEAASLAEGWISALVTAPPTPAPSVIHAKTLNIAAQVSSTLPAAHPSLWGRAEVQLQHPHLASRLASAN